MLEPRIDEVMTYIDSLMMDTDINPFRYDSVTGSRVLSGEEEAVFDWISVNYLLGNFAGTSIHFVQKKTPTYVFDHNSGVSWSIFILFVPVEREMNTLQITYLRS